MLQHVAVLLRKLPGLSVDWRLAVQPEGALHTKMELMCEAV